MIHLKFFLGAPHAGYWKAYVKPFIEVLQNIQNNCSVTVIRMVQRFSIVQKVAKTAIKF